MTTDRISPARTAAPTDHPAQPGEGSGFAALLEAHAGSAHGSRRTEASRRDEATHGDVSRRHEATHGDANRDVSRRDQATHGDANHDVSRRDEAPHTDVPGDGVLRQLAAGSGDGSHGSAAGSGDGLPGSAAGSGDGLPGSAAGDGTSAPAGDPATGADTPGVPMPAAAPGVDARQPSPFGVPVQAAPVAVPHDLVAAGVATVAPAATPDARAQVPAPVAAPQPFAGPGQPAGAPVPAPALDAAPAPAPPSAPAPAPAPAAAEALPATGPVAAATSPEPAAAGALPGAPPAPAAEPAPGPHAEPQPASTAPGPQPAATAPAAGTTAPERAVPLHRAPAAVATLLHVGAERGITHARMAIRPAELGGIEIRLQATAAGVAAQVVADSPEAARLLAQAGDDLRRALEARDVTLLSLEVSTSSDERSSHESAPREWSERDPEPVDDSPAAPPTRTVIELPGGLLVDVLA